MLRYTFIVCLVPFRIFVFAQHIPETLEFPSVAVPPGFAGTILTAFSTAKLQNMAIKLPLVSDHSVYEMCQANVCRLGLIFIACLKLMITFYVL